MSDDDHDFRLLSLANENSKFALQLGGVADAELQFAFERGIHAEWFTLVDVGPISAMPGKLFRIFRLTQAGRVRLAQLAETRRHG